MQGVKVQNKISITVTTADTIAITFLTFSTEIMLLISKIIMTKIACFSFSLPTITKV